MKGTPGIVQDTKSNEIVKSFADEVVEPINITNFETTDSVTPEVIVPNGSAAIFSQAGGTGWVCNDGDELIYQFEKFPSEVGAQTLVIGYILDGVMSVSYTHLSGIGVSKESICSLHVVCERLRKSWVTSFLVVVGHPVSYTHLDVYKRQTIWISDILAYWFWSRTSKSYRGQDDDIILPSV